jgi:hypothetical protein
MSENDRNELRKIFCALYRLKNLTPNEIAGVFDTELIAASSQRKDSQSEFEKFVLLNFLFGIDKLAQAFMLMRNSCSERQRIATMK